MVHPMNMVASKRLLMGQRSREKPRSIMASVWSAAPPASTPYSTRLSSRNPRRQSSTEYTALAPYTATASVKLNRSVNPSTGQQRYPGKRRLSNCETTAPPPFPGLFVSFR